MTSTTPKKSRRVPKNDEYQGATPAAKFTAEDHKIMLKSHFNLVKDDDAEVEEEMDEEPPYVSLPETPAVMEESDERVLKKSEISVRLSWLGKTAEGDGYTYLKATCTNMELTNIIALRCFKHLQFVDVSNNSLNIDTLQPVTGLPFLLLLQADSNQLSSAKLKKCKYLQVLILNRNNITSIDDVFHPQLSTLEVGYNHIREISLIRMSTLRCLDLRYNEIKQLPLDISFRNLDSLYLAGNKLKSLEGIDVLVKLRILHLRNNPIKHLFGFSNKMAKLQYINLRNCKVSSLKQVKKLHDLPALEVLVLKGTPLMGGPGKEDPDVADEEDDADIRVEILASLPRLQRLNKSQYEPEERFNATELMKQWLEEGEKEEEEEEEVGEEMQEEQLGEIPNKGEAPQEG